MLKDTEIGVGLTKGFDCLRTDAGCQSSLNRTIFAHKNWHLFSPGSTIGAPNNLLEHFKFIYFQIQNIKSKRIDEKNISQIRSKISSAEKSLIRELSPPCNNLKQSVLWNCDYAFKKIEMVAEDLSLAIDSLS
jgi:hypothetical protein